MDTIIKNKVKLENGDERHPIQIMNDSGVIYESYEVKPVGIWVFYNCNKSLPFDYS